LYVPAFRFAYVEAEETATAAALVAAIIACISLYIYQRPF